MAYVWGTKYKSFWSVSKLLSWLLYTLRHRLQLKQYRIFVLWHLSVEKALFTAIMSRLWWFHTSKWQRWFVASNPTLVVRYKATSQPLLRSFRGAACHSWLGKLSLMNELPVIGSMCLRKDLWDRHEANIATRQKEMWGERLFRRQKKRFWLEIIVFLPPFHQKWVWVALIQGKRKVLFEQPWNI